MSDDSISDLELGATVRGFKAEQEIFGRYRLKRVLGRDGMGNSLAGARREAWPRWFWRSLVCRWPESFGSARRSSHSLCQI